MKLSARLILLLTFSVSVVMVVASLITLRQREAALLDAARDEARVHAVTLQIALEEDYLTGRSLDAQRLINRLRENTGVYSAALFDAAGEIVAISNTLAPEEFRYLNEAREAPLNGKGLEIMRSISGEDYFSMILPLQVQGRRVGAIEIVQSISFVKADIARARFHVLITTLLLFGAILLVVAAVTRYSLARPIHELLDAAVALGRGDLNYRAPAPSGGGELASLAREFNRMADRLAEQRQSTLREAEERLALERKLRHSEQLAAVGRLAAGVAHEMGAPLQVIDGRAKQLLHHPDAPTETRRRNLIIIRNQAERIARIVRQLLNLSRPHKLYFRRIELTPLVEEAAELIETQAESAGVEIEVRCDGAAIDADPELIQQVLLNIFRNGIQAMPQGGRLRVECLKDAAERGGRNFAALRVSDTGVGIAPESLPNIFDPFFTTKEVGHGTGLGLPISSRIVEEHEGWIEAANGAESGAVFTIYLPQAGLTEVRAEATVLITGESGTGKELVARAIHETSERKGAFVPVNCAAIPAELMESELFGHTGQAFTGAKQARAGLFESADQGTLFLDEIGEMPLAVQPKLLRVLQEGRVRRVGADREREINVRVIAATNRDLEKEVSEGRFRDDLYWRLNVIHLHIPPLRERPFDIPLLVEHFINKIAEKSGHTPLNVPPETLATLTAYSWPGNARELENVIERACALATGSNLTPDDLPERVRSNGQTGAMIARARERRMTLRELEKEYIVEALRMTGGNKSRAAEILGIDRRTLHRKLDEYRAEDPSFEL